MGAVRAVWAVRAVRGEGGVGGGGLGTHWKPLNTSSRFAQPEPRAEGGEQWGSGVDKALRAVGAEGGWAHIGSL